MKVSDLSPERLIDYLESRGVRVIICDGKVMSEDEGDEAQITTADMRMES